MIISSWTNDKSSIDYVPEFDSVNLDNFIPNEEWVVISFNIRRVEVRCCACPLDTNQYCLGQRRKHTVSGEVRVLP